MVFQLAHPLADLRQPGLYFLNLFFQREPLFQFVFQHRALFFCLGNPSGTVIAAFVLQFPQTPLQQLGITAFISGGDQGIEPAPQCIILGQRQIRKADETSPAEHALLHSQQQLSAIGSRQFRNHHTRSRFKGTEFPHRDSPPAAAFYGDVAATPANIHTAGHRASRPGGVVILVCQGRLCGLNPGVQAIEHSHEEGAPGTLPPFILPLHNVQSRFQNQRFMFQFAEGSCHSVNSHGSCTSIPARSRRESSAANCALGFSDSFSRRK